MNITQKHRYALAAMVQLGFNYNKGARSKYSVTYNITKDDYGVQSCTKGEDVIEEPCSVNAFTPDLSSGLVRANTTHFGL